MTFRAPSCILLYTSFITSVTNRDVNESGTKKHHHSFFLKLLMRGRRVIIMPKIEILDQQGGGRLTAPCKSCANGKERGMKIIIKAESKENGGHQTGSLGDDADGISAVRSHRYYCISQGFQNLVPNDDYVGFKEWLKTNDLTFSEKNFLLLVCHGV